MDFCIYGDEEKTCKARKKKKECASIMLFSSVQIVKDRRAVKLQFCSKASPSSVRPRNRFEKY
jgi:hypothetical protein